MDTLRTLWRLPAVVADLNRRVHQLEMHRRAALNQPPSTWGVYTDAAWDVYTDAEAKGALSDDVDE